MLGRESGDVGPNVGLCPMPFQEPAHPRAGVAKKGLVDKLDGRRRALDVEEDGAQPFQRDADRRGM